jgi:hypothetical protein
MVVTGLLVGLVPGRAAMAGPDDKSGAIARHASSFATGVNWADPAVAKDKAWDEAPGVGLFGEAVRPLSRPVVTAKIDPTPSAAQRAHRLVADAPHLRGEIRNFADLKPESAAGRAGFSPVARWSTFGVLENLPGTSK